MAFNPGQTVYFLDKGEIKSGVFKYEYVSKEPAFLAMVSVNGKEESFKHENLSYKTVYESPLGEKILLGEEVYYQVDNFSWYKGKLTAIHEAILYINGGPVFGDVFKSPIDPFNMFKVHKGPSYLGDYIRSIIKNMGLCLKSRIQNFDPELKEGKLWIFKNLGDLRRKKKTPMRIGRAIRYMTINISDKELEEVVNSIVETFSGLELTLKRSSDPDDFEKVYTSKIVPETRLVGGYNSLAASCMRGSFNGLPCHPARAYGSGDFEIWWTEDSEGSVCSRVIVCPDNYSHGPIYASRPQGYEILDNALGEKSYSEGDFALGQRLLKIPYDSNRLVLPYIDTDSTEYVAAEFNDKYVLVTEDGCEVFYELSMLSGISERKSSYRCECCGEYHVPENIATVNDEYICEDCLIRHYSSCDHCLDFTKNDYLVQIGRNYYCPDCAEEVVECRNCGDVIEKEYAKTKEVRGVEEYFCPGCDEEFEKEE